MTDEPFAQIAPRRPTDTRGKERVDDRGAISSVVPVLKSGGRWTDAPREIDGPKKPLYNRVVRWVAKWSGSAYSRGSPRPDDRRPRC
jgi:transposase